MLGFIFKMEKYTYSIINLDRKIKIKSPKTLNKIFREIEIQIEEGIFIVTKGSFEFDDLIDCNFKNSVNNNKYWLFCETYHGSGGCWSPIILKEINNNKRLSFLGGLISIFKRT
jgi:hypothetical protein